MTTQTHTALVQRLSLKQENVENFDHPPYSPDLSPNNFFTFPKIKKTLRGQRFQTDEETVNVFKSVRLNIPTLEWNKCFINGRANGKVY